MNTNQTTHAELNDEISYSKLSLVAGGDALCGDGNVFSDPGAPNYGVGYCVRANPDGSDPWRGWGPQSPQWPGGEWAYGTGGG
jgi:hypothetical protein